MIPVACHIYVDGPYYRQNAQAAWAFVVVVEDVMGNFCLLGFAPDFLSKQHAVQFGARKVGNIPAEAVSIFQAISWLLTQPLSLACIHFDCTPVAGAVQGFSSPLANVGTIVAASRCFKGLYESTGGLLFLATIKAHDGGCF